MVFISIFLAHKMPFNHFCTDNGEPKGATSLWHVDKHAEVNFKYY